MDGISSHMFEESDGAVKDNVPSLLGGLLDGYECLGNHYKKLAEFSKHINCALNEGMSTNKLTTILKQKMDMVSSVEELSKHLMHLQKKIEESRTLTPSEKECVLQAREELKKTMDFALEMDEENRYILSRKGVKIKRPF